MGLTFACKLAAEKVTWFIFRNFCPFYDRFCQLDAGLFCEYKSLRVSPKILREKFFQLSDRFCQVHRSKIESLNYNFHALYILLFYQYGTLLILAQDKTRKKDTL